VKEEISIPKCPRGLISVYGARLWKYTKGEDVSQMLP
jgi:hypothetical protein